MCYMAPGAALRQTLDNFEHMNDRRRSAGSWIGGVRAAGADLGYPGERKSLPQEGPGSVAGYGRRLVALIADWLLAMLIAAVLSAAFHWTAQTRSLITLAMMVALNRPDEFRLHVRAAFNNGVTRDQIKEVLLQSAIYCGVPAANSAFHLAEEVFAQLDKPAT